MPPKVHIIGVGAALQLASERREPAYLPPRRPSPTGVALWVVPSLAELHKRRCTIGADHIKQGLLLGPANTLLRLLLRREGAERWGCLRRRYFSFQSLLFKEFCK